MRFLIFYGGRYLDATADLKVFADRYGIKLFVLERMVETGERHNGYSILKADWNCVHVCEKWDDYVPRLKMALKNERKRARR